MRGPLIVILAAVLAGVLLFVFTRGDDGDPSATGLSDLDGDEMVEEGDNAAMLVGDPSKRPPPERPQETDPTPPAPPPETDVLLVSGLVLDAESGDPIAGALVSVERMRAPCPRPPRISLPPEGTVPEGHGNPANELLIHARTDGEGRFRITQRDRDKDTGAMDLFVLAPGHVAYCGCGVNAGADVTVRLQAGGSITGTVRDLLGRPVGGATVRAQPAPPALPHPGNSVLTLSNEQGVFKLDGLTRESLIVQVDHPLYMPYASEVLAPDAQSPHAVTLVPAWSLRFRLETNDGQPARNPTLEWQAGTDTLQAAQGLQLLQPSQLADSERVDVKWKYRPVRIPANTQRVDLRLRADGYKAWETKGEPVPPEGGTHTFPVFLERDDSQGTLRIALFNQEEQPLSYAASGARLGIAWLGAPEDAPTSFVMQPQEILTIPGIRAGRYRFTIFTGGFAPARFETEIRAGEATEERVTLGPPARLRVRFHATGAERVVVRFLVKKDGIPVHAFPVDAAGAEGQAALPGGVPPLHAPPGDSGLLLTGLGEGRHTIEVTSPDLVATSQSVDLVLGDIREIEIDVTKR
jgi:hypothetical protein